jgi:hypothetical protein
MDTTVLFLFLVFFVLGYVTREFIGGSKKDKSESGKGDTIVRFWLDEQTVQHIELEGRELSVTDSSPEDRKHLAEVIASMQKWARLEEQARPSMAAAVVTSTAVVTSAAEVPVPVPVEVGEATKPRLDLTKGAKMFFTDNVARKVEPKPKSIIGMIDDVLQKKLETSPLKDKKIKLEDGPHGEVIVVVGVDRYTGVDDVPDPQVQAIIRESIAEWDRSQI